MSGLKKVLPKKDSSIIHAGTDSILQVKPDTRQKLLEIAKAKSALAARMWEMRIG